MKILLINPPTIIENTMNTQPVPVGLYSIQRVLVENGFSAQIINLSKCNTWSAVQSELPIVQDADIVGISCYTRQRFSVAHLAQLIKTANPSCAVCLGGPHASFLAVKMMEYYPAIDYVIREEGELSFLELARSIRGDKYKGNSDKRNILGLCFRDGDKIISNAPRHPVPSLNLLPNLLLPPEGLEFLSMSPSLLFHFPGLKKTERIAPILTSRGCSGSCRFCCNKAFWGSQRFCTGEYLIEQIMYYHNMGIRYFDFYDDNFTANIPALRMLADYVQDKHIEIHWWCSSRADYISDEVLLLLRKAGCFMVSLGVESGSQIILDNLRKNLSVSTIKKACSNIHEKGIALRITLSIGHHGENNESITKTLELVNKVKPSQVAIYLLKVYPGTPLYNDMVKHNQLSDDYWFDPKNDIVPFYTVENTIDELQEYQRRIENGIRGKVIHRYEDELGSVELDLDWRE